VSPLQGFFLSRIAAPGRCPGLTCFRPFRAIHDQTRRMDRAHNLFEQRGALPWADMFPPIQGKSPSQVSRETRLTTCVEQRGHRPGNRRTFRRSSKRAQQTKRTTCPLALSPHVPSRRRQPTIISNPEDDGISASQNGEESTANANPPSAITPGVLCNGMRAMIQLAPYTPRPSTATRSVGPHRPSPFVAASLRAHSCSRNARTNSVALSRSVNSPHPQCHATVPNKNS